MARSFFERLVLEPAGEGTLSQMLADRIAGAIRSGRLAPGTRLPSILRLAKLVGTSDQVPRAAFRILQDQNLVRARPRLGCHVLPTGVKTWRGRVLVVGHDAYEGYYHRCFFNTVGECLSKARYHVEFARLRPDSRGHCDHAELQRVLSDPCDLVVAFGYSAPILLAVRRVDLPFFLFGAESPNNIPQCIGSFESRADEALDALASAAKRAGVRKVLMVTFKGGQESTDFLTRHGLGVETRLVRPTQEMHRLQSFQQGGYATVSRALAGKVRPDLILIADDYLAMGGLVALSMAGCEAPRDIRFAAYANVGLGLAYPRAVTAVVSDPFADGELVAGHLVRFLEKGVRPGRVVVQRTFVSGRTL